MHFFASAGVAELECQAVPPALEKLEEVASICRTVSCVAPLKALLEAATVPVQVPAPVPSW